MHIITAANPAESFAAIATLKVGDVLKVPGHRARITVTEIDTRFNRSFPIVRTTGSTDDGCTLTACYIGGGFDFSPYYDAKGTHFYTFTVFSA
jgi:hypothetical protein